MINFTASNTKFLTATVALIAIVGSACGTAATTSSASDTDTVTSDTVTSDTVTPDTVTPDTVTSDTVVTEIAVAETSDAVAAEAPADVRTAPAATPAAAPVAVAEVVAAPTVEVEQYLNDDLISRQLIPASGFSFPCDQYFAATEYPVFPCSTGQLVEDFQNILNHVDPDFVVDGYFGEDTYDAVTGLQASYGMYQTGIIDDVLLEMAHLSILHTDSEEFDEVDDEGHAIADEGLAELCDTYDPAPGEEPNWDLINDCDAIGIRLVSGD